MPILHLTPDKLKVQVQTPVSMNFLEISRGASAKQSLKRKKHIKNDPFITKIKQIIKNYRSRNGKIALSL